MSCLQRSTSVCGSDLYCYCSWEILAVTIRESSRISGDSIVASTLALLDGIANIDINCFLNVSGNLRHHVYFLVGNEFSGQR